MDLTQGLHRSLQRQAGQIALTHLDDGAERHHTFAELIDSVARQASALAACGVRAGDRVALLAPNTDGLVQALLACWWLGAVACPLNVRWSKPELEHALADSEAALLLVDTGLAALVPDEPGLPAATLPAFAREARALPPRPDSRTGGDALAAILYTGGTTGRSKGVMLSHANFWSAAVARGAELPNSPESAALLVAPLFHVAGLGRLIGQMIVGGRWVTMPQYRPARVLQAIESGGVSDVIVVPSMLQSLMDHPDFRADRVQGLKRIAFGAAPMPPDLLDRALGAWPEAEFFQAYGMTETAGAVCMNPPENHRRAARARGLVNSVGQPGLGAEIMVTDETGRALPPGEVGEIVMRGPMVMRGYWRQPQTTQAALRDGWLRSGEVETALRAHPAERLAGYKCPRGFSFVAGLPTSAAGKVLKNVLRAQVHR